MENSEKPLKCREKSVHSVRWTRTLSIHRQKQREMVLHSDALHRWKNSVDNVENSSVEKTGFLRHSDALWTAVSVWVNSSGC